MKHPTQVSFRFSALFACLLLASAAARAGVPSTYQPNYDQGFSTGYTVGYDSGFVTGQARGVKIGTRQGQSDGYQAGWDETYPAAYDSTYAVYYPKGLEQGYVKGMYAGFDAGYGWAEWIASELWKRTSASNAVTLVNGSGFVLTRFETSAERDGNTIISSGTLSVQLDSGFFADPTKHYYDLGFGDGKKNGLSVGDAAGYDVAFPVAYATAYDTGHADGALSGEKRGLVDGKREGMNNGWNRGFGEGHAVGFDAGVQYFLYGDFTLPPLPDYAPESFGVPEPASIAGASVALIGLLCGTRRR